AKSKRRACGASGDRLTIVNRLACSSSIVLDFFLGFSKLHDRSRMENPPADTNIPRR
uniref:Uncharacterized protein n=1 Tax=Anopheles albimanus TaxID=7167 RepID=A0A182FAT1_ANOAL